MRKGDGGPALESADTVVPEITDAGEGGAAGTLPPGAKIGRYVLLSAVGSGGMGIVYRAFDPELDRSVALKVVRFGGPDATPSSDIRLRLVREAQAIARLSHPNVVAVHDVGVHGHTVFIAMEYVSGATLRQWQRPGRDWRTTVRMYIRAGRGLAAAHEAGLVHRDFKPENVLVGDDERPRVVDFGLVRAVGDSPELDSLQAITPPRVDTMTSHSGALSTPLTRAGAIMGTPGYMAPEQYTDVPADELSDQFSFCVALYEALYGHRPFRGDTVQELKRKVLGGTIHDDGGRDRRVPRKLRALVLRGLSVARDKRHPSMNALIDELERTIATPARARIAAGVAVAGVAIAGALLARGGAGDGPQPCAGAARKLAGIWDRPARDELAAVFAASAAPRAEATWKRVEGDLDAWSGAFLAKHRAVCEATHVHGEQSAAALDLRMACLDRHVAELRELAAVLAEGDQATLERAAVATGRLPDLADCDDLAALQAIERPPGDPELAREIEKLEGNLARAKALADAGRIADAQRIADTTVEAATVTAYQPLIARAHYMRGTALRLGGDGAGSRAELFTTLLGAERVGDDRLRAEATVDLIYVTGYLLGQLDEGARYGELAGAVLARLGDVPKLEARLLSNRGVLYHEQQRYQDAADAFLASIEVGEKAYGARSFDTVAALNNLGSALNELGRNQEARQYLERAIGILEDLFGPVHPHIAAVLVNLGLATYDLGDHETALASYERAVAIYEKVFGPDHPLLAPALTNWADVLADLERFDEAFARYERALAVREAAYGQDHPLVALALLGYGSARSQHGDLAAAAAQFERAQAIWERAGADYEADVARAMYGLSEVRRRQGRHRDAHALLARALAIQERVHGADHPALVETLTGLGIAELALGRPADAVRHLERAVELSDRHRVVPPRSAIARFALADALWTARPDQRSRARRLAEHALAELTTRGDASRKERDQVTAWLEKHVI